MCIRDRDSGHAAATEPDQRSLRGPRRATMSTSNTEPASSRGASPKAEVVEASAPAAAASAPAAAASTPAAAASAPAPAPAPAPGPAKNLAERPYSPGLAGVIAAETAIGYVDGANGRLLYRGYPIGQLVEKGTYGPVAA